MRNDEIINYLKNIEDKIEKITTVQEELTLERKSHHELKYEVQEFTRSNWIKYKHIWDSIWVDVRSLFSQVSKIKQLRITTLWKKAPKYLQEK